MNRTEFWDRYSKETGISKAKSRLICESVLLTLEKCIQEEDKVCIINFGTFKRKKYSARKINNLRGDGCIEIPAQERIVFEISENFGSNIEEQENDLDYKKLGEILFVAYREAEQQKELNKRIRTNEKITEIREQAQARVEKIKNRRNTKPKPRKSKDRLALEKLIKGLQLTLNGIRIDDNNNADINE